MGLQHDGKSGVLRDDSASRTAISVVRYRAAHQILDDDPKILDDPVSVGLVPGTSRTDILASGEQFTSRSGKAYREGFVTRSRLAEDFLRASFNDGVRQYVLLGAGLDTFAHRQPAWAEQLSIFEVDHPSTQGWKQELLRKKEITSPANLFYVACDFERMSLKEALAGSAHFDATQPAFFSWLGVVVYLTKSAIGATLKDVLALPEGSKVFFDAPLPARGVRDPAAEARRAAAESVGEPMITFLPIAEWMRWLAQLGFSEVTHVTPEQTYERYFQSRQDGLRPSRHYLLCTA